MTDTPQAPAAPEAPGVAPPSKAADKKPASKKPPAGRKPSNKKIMVRPLKPYKLHCHTQGVMIFPGTNTEVTEDAWVRHQIDHNTIKVV